MPTELVRERTRAQLVRLKWGLIFSPLLLLIPYEGYKILAVGAYWHEVLLDVILVMAGSLAVVQISFSIVLGLHERNVQQQERLSQLHQVDLKLSASLDQEQVIEAILESALYLTPARAARIFAYDLERQVFTAGWECLGPGECSSTDYRPRPNGFNARVAQTGDLLVIKDTAGCPSLFSIEDLERGLRAAVGIPLIHGNQTVGVLGIGYPTPRTFVPGELEVLRLLGSRAAVALNHARLFRQAEQGRDLAHTLLATAQALSTTLQLDKLLDGILDELQWVVPYDAASISLLHEEYGWPVASRGGEHSLFERFTLDEHPAVQRLVHEHKAVVIADVTADANDEPGLDTAKIPPALRSWLGVPLISKDQVIGVLAIDSHQPNTYDDEAANLVSAFAHQVALAIDNSRMYEQMRERLREATLLHGVMTALSSTLDVDRIMPYVARSLCEILSGSKVEIYSVDHEAGTATVISSYGMHETVELGQPRSQQKTHPLSDMPGAAEALDQQRPIQVQQNGPEVDPRVRAWLQSEGMQAELLLPMVARGRVVGFAQVWEAQFARHFTEEEIAVAQTLIHPAAIALENARLFSEVESARIELQSRATALEEANVRLQELDKLKSRFLVNMSHELRTPLNSIIGFSEILIDGLVGDLTPEQARCVRDILTSGEHLMELINDVLDLSKIEAGRMALSLDTVDVIDLLQEVRATVRAMIERKSQVLTVNYPDALPPLIADRLRVKQVLLNLLGNANKFTPPAGTIAISCQLVGANVLGANASHPTHILFSVIDSGIGIKPEDQEIIFDEFRQADTTIVWEARGTGLGLAISKRLIEMHGGRIWVESTYGQGANFSFELPLDGPVGR